MGQTTSTSLPSSLPDFALHCLRVSDGSPASGQLEPFFDYLVGIEVDDPSQTVPNLSPPDLARILEEQEGKSVQLKVYNAKSQRLRGDSADWHGNVLCEMLTAVVRCRSDSK